VMKYILGIMVFILFLSGCTSGSIYVQLVPGSRINLDAHNNPLPVLVKVYQLRDAQVFQQATFHDLWRHDKSALANSLLGYRQIMVMPSVNTRLKLHRVAKANYLGIVAIFRKPHNDSWRTLIDMPTTLPFIPSTVVVHLNGQQVIHRG